MDPILKNKTKTAMYIPLLSLVPILPFLASPPPSPNSGSRIALSQTVFSVILEELFTVFCLFMTLAYLENMGQLI